MNSDGHYKAWDERRGKIKSKKGGWKIGSGVESHGYDLINELVGHYSYMQVVVLNATGKMPSRAFADWIEAVHICLSWPDSRIWCNRIGALGGAAGASIIAAACSGTMAADSRAYGIRPIIDGIEFISDALQSVKERGLSVAEFVSEEVDKRGGKPYLMGYARPVAKGDERVKALEQVAKQLGFNVGSHLALAYEIEQELSSRFDESMNINGYVSAFMSDQGISAIDTYRLFAVVVASGVAACYVDNADSKQAMFSPLRVTDIDYEGKLARSIPE